MQSLFEIISYKFKLIAKYSQASNIITISQLLREKKRQASNSIIEQRYIQGFINIPVDQDGAEYNIVQNRKLFDSSLKLMKIYDESFDINKGFDNYQNCIRLYMKFFKLQQKTQRAQQILILYSKKVCTKQLLLPTIFHWFVQWVRKTFSKFIKLNLKNYQTIPKSSKIGIKQQPSMFQNDYSTNNPQQQSIIEQQQTSQPNKQPKILRQMRSMKQLYQQQKLSPRKLQTKKLIINKDIFYGIFYQEMQNYYKNYTFIEDLDQSYLRLIKKVHTKKQMYFNRMKQIVEYFANNQPFSQKAITQYSSCSNIYFQNKLTKPKNEKYQFYFPQTLPKKQVSLIQQSTQQKSRASSPIKISWKKRSIQTKSKDYSSDRVYLLDNKRFQIKLPQLKIEHQKITNILIGNQSKRYKVDHYNSVLLMDKKCSKSITCQYSPTDTMREIHQANRILKLKHDEIDFLNKVKQSKQQIETNLNLMNNNNNGVFYFPKIKNR